MRQSEEALREWVYRHYLMPTLLPLDAVVRLSLSEIQALMRGERGEADRAVRERCAATYRDAAEATLPTAGFTRDSVSDDEWEALVQVLFELNTADPLARAIERGGKARLLRYPLADIGQLVAADPVLGLADEAGLDARREVLTRVLFEHGAADNRVTRRAVDQINDGGPGVWGPQTVFALILLDAPLRYALDAPSSRRSVTITDSHPMLLDASDGYGWESELPGEICVELSSSTPMLLDETCQGVTWTSVYGAAADWLRPTAVRFAAGVSVSGREQT